MHATTMSGTALLSPVASQLAEEITALERFVRRRLGKGFRLRESANDIVQSVCRDVLEKRCEFEFRGAGAFRRFLQRRAMHKIYGKWEYHNAQKRAVDREYRGSSTNDSKPVVEELAKTTTTPSRILIRNQDVQQVLAAVEKLPAKYREAVTMNKLAGLSSVEIARRTGQTPGAVRNQVYRGLALLAGLLEAN